ncbi:hypothetical protein MHK_000613 [Candidatus Magnetomorum sp. HK-1]|nr:hypothetical protein MHK_000613 [Candidatus Magnetomorum sp. HK-1]
MHIFKFLILLLSINLNCCGLNPCTEEDVFRQTSPDNLVDVIVINRNCGATTSISNSVYIVPKGELTDKYRPVFVADHVVNLKVKWLKSKFLVISYAEARIFEFTNFWNSRYIENFMYEVRIKEIQIDTILRK